MTRREEFLREALASAEGGLSSGHRYNPVIAAAQAALESNWGGSQLATRANNIKRWLSSRDERVRESHDDLDGEVVPIDEDFSNGLAYPGDPSGPADEVIQCRCVAVYESRRV